MTLGAVPAGWRTSGRRLRGGQCTSFIVTRDATGEGGFLKLLTRNGDSKARARFRREVVAYETLTAPNLPALLEHNAQQWGDRDVQLYLVLEPIQGPNLGEHVRTTGPIDLETALLMIMSLLGTLESCHSEGTIHRDIKPANVMLRNGDPTKPVLVDFGLSFNADSDLDDLTRVGEEVGNRFLRLPEQAFLRRSELADVTQAAGLLFFAATGEEPRVLVDDEGLMPHQRSAPANRLHAATSGAKLRRLLCLFDRAFANAAAYRFQSVIELREAAATVRDTGGETKDRTYESLLVRLEETVNTASNLDLARRQQLLSQLCSEVWTQLRSLAKDRKLQVTQTARQINPAAGRAEWADLARASVRCLRSRHPRGLRDLPVRAPW
jgi:eukaryotic-like serine/threonine-protein kinase